MARLLRAVCSHDQQTHARCREVCENMGRGVVPVCTSVPLYLDHHRLVMGVTSSMLFGREYPPGRRDGNGRSDVPGVAIV